MMLAAVRSFVRPTFMPVAATAGARFMSAARKYTETHEYVSMDGDVATVGITQYAQDSLGDVVLVDLPAVGSKFSKGDKVLMIESVKITAPVYAPLPGSVVEVNSALKANPELVNESPYEKGWLFKLKVADKGPLATMLDEAGYDAITK